MRFFCLSPSLEAFREVASNAKIARDMPENLRAWKAAAAFKWGYCVDAADIGIMGADCADSTAGEDSADSAADTDADFLSIDAQFGTKNPTHTKCEQMMYIFYATGELKYIDLFYQCMGTVMSSNVRRVLADMFRITRDEYRERLSAMSPQALADLPVPLSYVDFSHFDEENIGKYRQICDDKQKFIRK
jgi:hypothetical protein